MAILLYKAFRNPQSAFVLRACAEGKDIQCGYKQMVKAAEAEGLNPIRLNLEALIRLVEQSARLGLEYRGLEFEDTSDYDELAEEESDLIHYAQRTNDYRELREWMRTWLDENLSAVRCAIFFTQSEPFERIRLYPNGTISATSAEAEPKILQMLQTVADLI